MQKLKTKTLLSPEKDRWQREKVMISRDKTIRVDVSVVQDVDEEYDGE